MATAYDCKFIETSVGINHNVDELLVGLLTQIRLKLENPEKSRFVHSQLPHTHTQAQSVCVCVCFVQMFLRVVVTSFSLCHPHFICLEFLLFRSLFIR